MRERNLKLEEWKKNYSVGKPYLSWCPKDYEAWDLEIPNVIIDNPGKTEGEMMSEEDIEAWLKESFRVLLVVKEENVDLFQKLHNDFIQDINYLYEIEKIDIEALEKLKDATIFDF